MGGCVGNSSDSVGLVLLKGNESVVCEICNVCFNTKDRLPIIVCSNNHNACLACLDGFREKDIKQCPFCRNNMNLSNPQHNFGLIKDLEKYEKQEKNFSAAIGPRVKTDDELVKQTYQLALKYGYQDVIKKTVSHVKAPVQEVLQIKEQYGQIDTAIELSVFKKLTSLYINKNKFTKIGYFGSLPNLKVLNLQKNQIEKINPMNNYYRLQQLRLNNNQIVKIENLGILSNLKILDLSYNSIKKIENLSQLLNLTDLNLSHNKIQKIQNLETLTSLKILSLGYNIIEKIQGLITLVNLKKLMLNNNQINKIENLETLSALQDLQIQGNYIEIVENLFELKSLKVLNINPEYRQYEFKQKNKGAIDALRDTFKVKVNS